MSSDLLNWLEQQLTLPVMNKLPDANQEWLEEDIEVLQRLVRIMRTYVIMSCEYKDSLLRDA